MALFALCVRPDLGIGRKPAYGGTREMQKPRDRDDDTKLLANEKLLRDLKARDVYIKRLFLLGVCWLLLLLVIVGLQGFGLWSFSLASSVLVTLIGSTTTAVLGLFAIAARYLFPSP